MSASKPFRGVVNLDIRDSVPDWSPYEQPRASDGAPNVLVIVWDDVGFASFESFGGPIQTPTMKRLADNGLRYTQFHTTSMCSPTRAALLTGRNHTTVGMGCITDLAMGFPGSNGHIPFETATVAEVLSERGYNTYAVGKWHLTPSDETNMAATKRNWPIGRGFERFYGFLGGETSQYYPDLVQDQQFVDAPAEPVDAEDWLAGEQGYHLTEDLVDRAIAMIGDAKQVAPGRPFLMYFCPGACKYKALPLEDRDAQTIFNSPRPRVSSPRDRFVYYPNTIEVPEPAAVNIRGRSYKIAANVEITSVKASGVLFAHGHSFGGHALYIRQGTLKYVYNFLGEQEQILTSELELPHGPCVLGVEFLLEATERIRNAQTPNQGIGTARLYVNDQQVAEYPGMRTQLRRFSQCGEGFNVGLDRGSPVTTDYPGASPWRFTGGTINRVTADVSGEPYPDFELELAALMSVQ
jgi:hypothetical protein